MRILSRSKHPVSSSVQVWRSIQSAALGALSTPRGVLWPAFPMAHGASNCRAKLLTINLLFKRIFTFFRPFAEVELCEDCGSERLSKAPNAGNHRLVCFELPDDETEEGSTHAPKREFRESVPAAMSECAPLYKDRVQPHVFQCGSRVTNNGFAAECCGLRGQPRLAVALLVPYPLRSGFCRSLPSFLPLLPPSLALALALALVLSLPLSFGGRLIHTHTYSLSFAPSLSPSSFPASLCSSL
eukprot:6182096-Pleurochrysis_carterae.AAC.1